MLTITLGFLAVIFLAYSNGANDNFKTVATLFGSGTTNYKRALFWTTLMTFLGSLTAVFFSQKLIAVFSGSGLVAETLVHNQNFIIAIALGAALTVFIATLGGFPVSTTHALTGALVGAGLLSAGGIHYAKLWEKFFLPLLVSPLLSLALTILLYPLFKTARRKWGVQEETCICIGEKEEIVEVTAGGAAVLRSTGLALTLDQLQICRKKYLGSIAGVSAQEALNALHYLTAGATSFARGLNDTPKIVALLTTTSLMGARNGILLTGLAIAIGGILNARKVAETMSKRITTMNHGQGFTANLITALLVIFASRAGLPVSTTHVACSSLFGIGLVSGKARLNVITNILLSWVITLPLAAILSGTIFYLVS